MKKQLCLTAGILLLSSATVFADPGLFARPVSLLTDGPFLLADDLSMSHSAPASAMPVAMTEAAGVELFPCVNYRKTQKIHPCATPMVIMVKDPCFCKDRCNPCAQPGCVAVEICAPPSCCPPKVTCNRDGSRVKYDWGKCEVVVVSKKGEVCVTYK